MTLSGVVLWIRGCAAWASTAMYTVHTHTQGPLYTGVALRVSHYPPEMVANGFGVFNMTMHFW